MNHLKWAGWGVIDVEKLDKQQRRNYLKKVRLELAEHGYTLHPGGSTKTPYYALIGPNSTTRQQTYAGEEAFAKICAFALEQLGEHRDVSGEDGGVRCAGDEAQAATGDVAA